MEEERTEEWYCALFEERCDDVTQLDVDELNDFSQCNGECKGCWNCIND